VATLFQLQKCNGEEIYFAYPDKLEEIVFAKRIDFADQVYGTEVAKDDVRGVARYLEVQADVDDLILIPDTDWSLPFEYQGEANVNMPGLDDPESKWSNLADLTTGINRVFLVDYQHGTRDWQGMLPFALAKAGSMASERDGSLWRSRHCWRHDHYLAAGSRSCRLVNIRPNLSSHDHMWDRHLWLRTGR